MSFVPGSHIVLCSPRGPTYHAIVDKQGLIYFDGEDRVVERAEAEDFVNWTPVLDRPRYSRREVLKRASDQLENPDIDFVNSEDFGVLEASLRNKRAMGS